MNNKVNVKNFTKREIKFKNRINKLITCLFKFDIDDMTIDNKEKCTVLDWVIQAFKNRYNLIYKCLCFLSLDLKERSGFVLVFHF